MSWYCDVICGRYTYTAICRLIFFSINLILIYYSVTRHFCVYYSSKLPVELNVIDFLLCGPIPGTKFISAQNLLNDSRNTLIVDDHAHNVTRYYFNSENNLYQDIPQGKYKVTTPRATSFLGMLLYFYCLSKKMCINA